MHSTSTAHVPLPLSLRAALAPMRTPVRGSRASRSRNVSVQANLFSRVVRLIKSTAGNLGGWLRRACCQGGAG